MQQSRSAWGPVFGLGMVLAVSGLADAVPPPYAISECGTVVGEATEAFLTGDLDCSDWALLAERPLIALGKGNATLDLRGFTLTGGTTGHALVQCSSRCTIIGNGGTMVGGAFSVTAINRVKVIDATLRDMRTKAVYATRRSEIDGVTITGSRTGAITSPKTVVIRNSTIFDNGGRPVPETGEVQYYSAIIFAGNIRVYDSVIIDNAWGGIESSRAYVRGSTLTGNGTFPECGVTRNCKFDIGTVNRPSVSESSCTASLNRKSCAEELPAGVECNGDTPYTPEVSPELHNWGVCSLD